MSEHTRCNISHEEKENKEKEMRNQIIAEADAYKKAFYEKRDKTIETNKSDNREREKVNSLLHACMAILCVCVCVFDCLSFYSFTG